MKILKFSTKHCGQCMALDRVLKKENIDYTEIDCEENPEMATQYHILGIPVVVFESDDGTREFHRFMGPRTTEGFYKEMNIAKSYEDK